MARKRKSQRGAALAIVMASIVGLCGVAALAIDEGIIWNAKQRAQNIADAAVLAAAQAMENSGGASASAQPALLQVADNSAEAAAKQIAYANNKGTQAPFKAKATDSSGGPQYTSYPTNITADDGSVYSPAPGRAVRVDGYVNAPTAFGRVVGFAPTSNDGVSGATSVPAHAIAVIENLYSTTSAVPFGPVADQPNSSDPTLAAFAAMYINPPTAGTYQTKEYDLKADSNGGSSIQAAGNFGAIDLPGSVGGKDYEDNIAKNSNSTVYVGEVLSTETGDKVGPTQSGMAARLDPTNRSFTHYFSSYDEWFFGRSTDPSTGKPFPAADPPTVTTADGVTHYVYQDPEKQNASDAHLAVVPFITSPSKNGKASVTVMGFGVFFIDNASPSDGAVVTGRFVSMAVSGTGYRTPGQGGGGAYTISLVQ